MKFGKVITFKSFHNVWYVSVQKFKLLCFEIDHKCPGNAGATSWIILAIIVAVAIYAIYVFNRLVSLRQLANEGWSGIDVQLKRRSDLDYYARARIDARIAAITPTVLELKRQGIRDEDLRRN